MPVITRGSTLCLKTVVIFSVPAVQRKVELAVELVGHSLAGKTVFEQYRTQVQVNGLFNKGKRTGEAVGSCFAGCCFKKRLGGRRSFLCNTEVQA